jgi:septal ring factor EnvC (AmiA/AmiB activator)
MKKSVVLFGLVFVAWCPLWCSTSLSSSEREELTQIVEELSGIVDEQQTIIENSQKRNEELELNSKKQSELISELQTSSDSKQKIIDEQQKTIDELKNSSTEPKRFSLLTLINSFVAAFVSFCGGVLVGLIFL